MMKVLIACEFSGVVRDAFAALGHDAISCDLLPTERPGKHYQGDVRDLLFYPFDLMIAHPPCTDLAVSGASHFAIKQVDGRQYSSFSFFMQLVKADIPMICIENPVSIVSSLFRKPDQIIHPYFFGDPIPKKTCLWLKNLPPLVWHREDNLFNEKTMVEPEYLVYKSAKTKTGFSRYSKFGKLGSGHGHERSVTSPSIAKAMAEQWGNIII